MKIKKLEKSDYNQWLPLWNANCLNQIDQTVTNQTWQRICDPDETVNGFGAHIDGKLVGMVHYILHPVTGNLNPAAYMQDVFVDETMRRRGIARALVEHLGLHGREQGWARLYWMAEKDNAAAQNLYKTLGITIDFTLHILPTENF
ncbi:MAG: GNAT family N-acetyltransferase [Pseudomonadota bacterium]